MSVLDIHELMLAEFQRLAKKLYGRQVQAWEELANVAGHLRSSFEEGLEVDTTQVTQAFVDNADPELGNWIGSASRSRNFLAQTRAIQLGSFAATQERWGPAKLESDFKDALDCVCPVGFIIHAVARASADLFEKMDEDVINKEEAAKTRAHLSEMAPAISVASKAFGSISAKTIFDIGLSDNRKTYPPAFRKELERVLNLRARLGLM